MAVFLCQYLSHFLDNFWGFCLSMAVPNLAHPQSFPSHREIVHTISAHGFPPVHLHQHFTCLCCSFPQFIAQRIYMLLHCAVTLYVILTTFNWPQSVYTVGHMQSMLCVDCPHVSEEPCAHTCANLRFNMTPFMNFLGTPCTYIM